MIKVTILRTTRTKCSYCKTDATVKVEEDLDTKKFCGYHETVQPERIRKAIDARRNPVMPVTQVALEPYTDLITGQLVTPTQKVMA